MLSLIYLLAAIGATAKQDEMRVPTPPPAPIIITSAVEEPERVLVGKEERAVPLGNPGQWVNTDDYPSTALSKEKMGVTSFRVQVNRSGRVTALEVTVSSGHADLDAATCQYVSERAVFSPARDRRGRAITDTYSNRVRWQIPQDPIELPSPGSQTFVFTVEKDGSVSDCKHTGFVNAERDPCANAPSFVSPVNQKGDPVRKQVIISTVTRVGILADNELD